jgi:hypothetical protein
MNTTENTQTPAQRARVKYNQNWAAYKATLHEAATRAANAKPGSYQRLVAVNALIALLAPEAATITSRKMDKFHARRRG